MRDGGGREKKYDAVETAISPLWFAAVVVTSRSRTVASNTLSAASSPRQLHRTNLPKQEIRRRIVSLNRNRAAAQPQTLAPALLLRSFINPVRYLISIHPNRQMRPIGNDRLRKPLHVIRHHSPGRLPTVNRPRPKIPRLRPIT